MMQAASIVAAKVSKLRRVGSAGTLIQLSVPSTFGRPLAGQFVQIACQSEGIFRLPRPFSIASWETTSTGGEIGILFAVVGDGTRWLDSRIPGDAVELVGPLGRPFRILPGRLPVLVAGGRGIAPLLHLADSYAGDHPDGLLLYGAEDEAALFPTEESPYPVYRSTLDGSVGQTGTVLDLLQGMLERGAVRRDSSAIYGCGPMGMLEALSRLAVEASIPVQVSLETIFGCGTGLCAGCAIPMRQDGGGSTDAFGRYAFACTDGPVFDGALVDWAEVRE